MRRFVLGLTLGIIVTGTLTMAGQLTAEAVRRESDLEVRRFLLDLERNHPPVITGPMYQEMAFVEARKQEGTRTKLIRLITVPGILVCASESGSSHPLIDWVDVNSRFVDMTLSVR